MKHRLKRVLCIAAGLILSAGCLPDAQVLFPDGLLTASAAEHGKCGYGVMWVLDNGVLKIMGEGSMDDFFMTNAPWHPYEKEIRSVVIEEGVTGIGRSAFYKCSALTEVTIPDSLLWIDGSAFEETPWMQEKLEKSPLVIFNGILINGENCEGDVIIPEGVTSISIGAFSYCRGLTSITIPDSVTKIHSSAFEGCANLEEIHLPAHLPYIDDRMMYGCKNLKSVTIPDSVNAIYNTAFYDCSDLEEITIPSSVKYIGMSAFSDCRSLRSINFLSPECKIEIGSDTICNTSDFWTDETSFTGSICGYEGSTAQKYAEKHAYNFTSYGEVPKRCGEELTWSLENGVLTISGKGEMWDVDWTNFSPKWKDESKTIQRIILEDGITSIGNYAFSECNAVSEIKIPGSVKRIGNNAFEDCTRLMTVDLSDGVESIEKEAFSGCKGLSEVNIPESLSQIGADAFEDTLWLKLQREKTPLVIVNNIVIDGQRCEGTVRIPEGVVCIGGNAFYNADDLSSIVMPATVKEIQDEAFRSCSDLLTVSLPNRLTYLGAYAFSGCNALKSITIPEGVTEIKKGTFDSDVSLQSVSLPSTVTKIEESAFAICKSLTKITIPNRVKSIGEMAFYGCSSLAEIEISANVSEIGPLAFRRTAYLADLKEKNKPLIYKGVLIDGSSCQGDVIIPGSVTIIGERAFESCDGVTSITIPETVTEIRKSAFEFCNPLEEIRFMGPYCKINMSSSTICSIHDTNLRPYDQFYGVIRGYEYSTAHFYADHNKYTFLALPPRRGDYNVDNTFSITDAVLLSRFAVEDSTLSEEQITRILAAEPDYDRNGTVSVFDVTALLKSIGGQ